MEAIVDHTFQRQHCEDIDECLEGARCGYLGVCRNLIGGYECTCPANYVRANNTNDCVMASGTCDGAVCPKTATCKHIVGRRWACKCRVGFAGDGQHCGNDRDLDGWPDTDLGCESIFCRQDNCPSIPNSGQVRMS
jgi:thrombospondin 2/3/4/5